MRARWPRAHALVPLDLAALTELIQPAFPGRTVIASEPTAGGLSNTNLRLTLAERQAPVRLRLYTRHPDRAALEVAVMARASTKVAVPRVLHVTESNPVTGHPYALLDWIDGVRLELAAADTPASDLSELGRCIGTVMARFHSVTFDTYGFFDTTLAVAHAIDLGSAGLTAYLRQCFLDGRGGERVGSELTERLLRHADRCGPRLDSSPARPCLAHGDFGGSNILVQRRGGGWRLGAILDWEYALSGTPFFDFGNLLRPPLGDAPAFVEGLGEGYRAAGGELPDHWLQLARLTDLFAWADLANREESNDAVIADARAAILRCLEDEL